MILLPGPDVIIAFVVGWWFGATALWRYRPICRREHVDE